MNGYAELKDPGLVGKCPARLDILRKLPYWLLLAAGVVWPAAGYAAWEGSVPVGGHRVEVVDGLVRLEAREAPLRSVVRDLERALGIGIRMTGDADRSISASYDRVSVERVLTGLGVNYVLVYGRDPVSRQPRLTRGGISGAGVRSAAAPPTPNRPQPQAIQDPGTTPGETPGEPPGEPIPVSQEEEGTSILYTVMDGDTVRQIAMLFLVSMDDIRSLNGMTPNQEVTPGQTLKIPTPQR